MFDARLRPLIDPPLNWVGDKLAALGVAANAVTLLGAATGVAVGVAIGIGSFLAGLLLIIVNRLFDGLDGAIARATLKTDFGGYLDIVADYFFYVAVPLGFGFSDPARLPYALALVAAFTLTATSFLAFAAIAARRGNETRAHGEKSFYYSTGLAEGAETIGFFIAMCLWPDRFDIFAGLFTGLCLLTVLQRSTLAWRAFAEPAGDPAK